MQFRKKPIVIDAWPFHGNRTDVIHSAIPDWLRAAINEGRIYYQGGDAPYYTIETLEGTMRADVDDWIIRGVEGEIYPCKPSVFPASYEPVE
jgi:hypothetical protein